MSAGFLHGLSEAIALLHVPIAIIRLAVQLWCQPRVEDRKQTLAQEGAAGHPLVVASIGVLVWPVEPPAWKHVHDPKKELFVVRVHAERDMRLAPVAAEVPLAYQNSE